MSTPSVTNSSSSKLNQFGLYRTIDERTEEFLKLSRKRQMRQGCLCAAISTAITVTIVVSVLLLYEYHIIGHRVLERRAATSQTKQLYDVIAEKDAMKLTFLPSFLNLLSKEAQDKSIDIKPSMPTTEYKDFGLNDLSSKMKLSSKGMQQKTSPIIFLKTPLSRLDFYSKARKAKKRMNPKEFHFKGNNMNLSRGMTVTRKAKIKVASDTSNVTMQPNNIQKTKNCTCIKNLQELILMLVDRIQHLMSSQLVHTTSPLEPTKHKSCCKKETTVTRAPTTTEDPTDYLESENYNMTLKPLLDLKSIDDSKIKTTETNVKTTEKTVKTEIEPNDTVVVVQEKPVLFEEYLNYIAKRHSLNTEKPTTVDSDITTTVASYDIQIETETNYIEITTRPEDKKYMHIAKINNPKLKYLTTPTTIVQKAYTLFEPIIPPNQPGESYNIFLKVLQEYKELDDEETKTLFTETVGRDSKFNVLPIKPANINYSINNFEENSLNEKHSTDTYSTEPMLTTKKGHDNYITPIEESKTLEYSKSRYIKLVNGNHNLHTLTKKHNAQYNTIISEEAKNSEPQYYTTVSAKASNTDPSQPISTATLPSIQVIHQDRQESKKHSFIYHKTKSEKPDTNEDYINEEIDDQMVMDDINDFNGVKNERKVDSQRFGHLTSWIPFGISKVLSGRPSYLEISSRNDWSPHFYDDTLDI